MEIVSKLYICFLITAKTDRKYLTSFYSSVFKSIPFHTWLSNLSLHLKRSFFQQYKLNFRELNVECLWTEKDLQIVLSFRDSSSRRWPPFTFHIFYLWQDSSSHNDRKASLFEWRIHFPFKNSNRILSTVDTNHVIRLKCFKHI